MCWFVVLFFLSSLDVLPALLVTSRVLCVRLWNWFSKLPLFNCGPSLRSLGTSTIIVIPFLSLKHVNRAILISFLFLIFVSNYFFISSFSTHHHYCRFLKIILTRCRVFKVYVSNVFITQKKEYLQTMKLKETWVCA